MSMVPVGLDGSWRTMMDRNELRKSRATQAARLMAAAALLVTLTQAASAHDDADRWYQPREHDWHGGYHRDWHSGWHYGAHNKLHWDPYYGWHYGRPYGPHAGGPCDWHVCPS